MKKYTILIVAFCFLSTALLLNAQPQVVDESGEIKPIGDLVSELNSSMFKVEEDGLILTANLPRTVKNLASIVLEIKLINVTGSKLIYKANNGLFGLNFNIEDDNQKNLDVSDYFKGRREGSLSFDRVSIDSGSAVEISIPLKKFVPLAKVGKYKLFVDWADMEMRAAGWRRADIPKIQLTGSFLLQSSGNGISITPVN